MSDDRPSIAELRELGHTADGEGCEDVGELLQAMSEILAKLAPATPILLEIAAAALARQDAMARVDGGLSDDWGEVNAANDRLAAAVAKVRP